MSSALQTCRNYVLLTKANTNLQPAPRALWVGTPGTANLMKEDGTIAEDFPLQAGLNPFVVLQLREGGDAENIWACYE